MTTNNPSNDSLQHKWQADADYPKLMETFRKKMGEIVDPELGLSIIDLGLVRDVIVDENAAQMIMILTTPFCPYGPAMLEEARAKAEEILKRPVTVEMGLDMWDPSMLEEGSRETWGWF
jgi:metal-sulfur cluster biosynthetic enzyme